MTKLEELKLAWVKANDELGKAEGARDKAYDAQDEAEDARDEARGAYKAELNRLNKED